MADIIAFPSLIVAASTDAANRSMRAANRSVWDETDREAYVDTFTELVRKLYSRPGDMDLDECRVRYSLAADAERRGEPVVFDDVEVAD